MHLPPVTVYRSSAGLVAQRGEDLFELPGAHLDELFVQEEPGVWLRQQMTAARPVLAPESWLAPIESQEVWAAGVTYLRSRDARIDDDRVYAAERPEIFFKATPHRVVGSGGDVRLRSDSRWNVPEPEVALAINRQGRIFGYSIGNDMSSRDIEGENPLYLPQAKVYSASCGLGPGVVVREPLPAESGIEIRILRGEATVFSGATALNQMKRTFPELAEFLYRDNDFPAGCFLLTGTGVVPPNDFTLEPADEIQISVAGLGTLVNRVA
jgi:2-dehydro-3-deoxy-D-arabinonate dehydratase